MGLLHHYFTAASDDDAAKVVHEGPDANRFDVVDLPDLDPYIVLLEVEAQLRDREEDEVENGPRFARTIAMDGGATVYTVSDELQQAIAAAPRARIAEVAAAVVENAAEEDDDDDDREYWLNALTHHLDDLGDLSRRALGNGHRVYAWVSL